MSLLIKLTTYFKIFDKCAYLLSFVKMLDDKIDITPMFLRSV